MNNAHFHSNKNFMVEESLEYSLFLSNLYFHEIIIFLKSSPVHVNFMVLSLI